MVGLSSLVLTTCLSISIFRHEDNLGLAVKALTVKATPSRLERAAAKAAAKLKDFAQKENSVIVVDGNNVRGSANFRWHPVELHGRIGSLCKGNGISRVVVVWDHGNIKFSASIPNETVDMVAIFSGLTQRADNVIVKESSHLAKLFCNEDWASLCFVTNDKGLQGRLISRANTSSPTMTSLRRPFLMDSTRFVKLLESSDYDSDDYGIEKDSCRVYNAQISFEKFAKLRREKTWQRCVLGEELRRSLCSYHKVTPCMKDPYIKDLEQRGYLNPSSTPRTPTHSAILGPSRLDKRQCGLLIHYNQAMHPM